MDRRLGTLRRTTLGALIGGVGALALALWLVVVPELGAYDGSIHLPWWALAAGFALTEAFVVRAHARGSAHSISLAKIPLVLGLLLAEPFMLVPAMVVGPAVVLLTMRAPRLWLRLARLGLIAVVATVTLHMLVPPPAEFGPLVWGATFAAVFVASLCAALLTCCAILLTEGSVPGRRLIGLIGADLLVALTNTSVGLAGATIIAMHVHAGWLMVPPAVLLLLAYRSYLSERTKHQSLDFLYGITRSLSRGQELEPELLDLLRRTRSRFRVRVVELVLLAGETGAGALRTSLGADGREEAMEPMPPASALALRVAVRDDAAVLVERDACAPELARYLASRGIEQALVAPVHGETRLTGVMVLGDRLGSSPSFSEEDLRLLETLAHHAGLSLEFDRLERQALSDPLTGLANRTLFLDRVSTSLGRSGGTVTVLFADLDDFKAVNDGAGHAAGDAVLVAVAGRIQASVRPQDVAARIGGDEFAVLLEDVDDREGEQVAQRMLGLLGEAVSVDGRSHFVRSSVGIASAVCGSLMAAELLDRADVAMYRAKAAGKGQVRVWGPEMEPAGVLEVVGHEELSDALARGELVAVFQPVASLGSGEVVAAEALARWRHPRRGLLGPGSFMPAAVAYGLVAEVDRAVLSQACAAAAAGAFPSVHVNVAEVCALTVTEVLEATGLEPGRLVLELTEAALAEASPSALARLQGMGVRLAFDDFGTGDGALRLLHDRRLDLVKLARPFVEGLGRSSHDRAVLSLLVQLGTVFGVQVVAEGIERADQLSALAELGCELGQGYLLGRPLSLEAAAPTAA